MYLFGLLLIVIFVLPKFWLTYTINRYDKELSGMPFNAKEFGELILKEKNLTKVSIEETNLEDHYDLTDNAVRVKTGRLKKKSITSLAIVCHEIGHAIQHKEEYGPLNKRTNIVEKTRWLSKIGGGILYSGLPLIIATGYFSLIKICLLLVLSSILIGVLIHLITLDVEIDASFNLYI